MERLILKNTEMKNKSYRFTINLRHLNLILTPPNQRRGYCFRCNLEKEIRVISERLLTPRSSIVREERKFCLDCALTNLTELEESDYEFEDKDKMIKEIRANLSKDLSSKEEDKELLECYG